MAHSLESCLGSVRICLKVFALQCLITCSRNHEGVANSLTKIPKQCFVVLFGLGSDVHLERCIKQLDLAPNEKTCISILSCAKRYDFSELQSAQGTLTGAKKNTSIPKHLPVEMPRSEHGHATKHDNHVNKAKRISINNNQNNQITNNSKTANPCSVSSLCDLFAVMG